MTYVLIVYKNNKRNMADNVMTKFNTCVYLSCTKFSRNKKIFKYILLKIHKI